MTRRRRRQTTGLLHDERRAEAIEKQHPSGRGYSVIRQGDSVVSLLQNQLPTGRADFIHKSRNGCVAFPLLLRTRPENGTDPHNPLSEFVRGSSSGAP